MALHAAAPPSSLLCFGSHGGMCTQQHQWVLAVLHLDDGRARHADHALEVLLDLQPRRARLHTAEGGRIVAAAAARAAHHRRLRSACMSASSMGTESITLAVSRPCRAWHPHNGCLHRIPQAPFGPQSADGTAGAEGLQAVREGLACSQMRAGAAEGPFGGPGTGGTKEQLPGTGQIRAAAPGPLIEPGYSKQGLPG